MPCLLCLFLLLSFSGNQTACSSFSIYYSLLYQPYPFSSSLSMFFCHNKIFAFPAFHISVTWFSVIIHAFIAVKTESLCFACTSVSSFHIIGTVLAYTATAWKNMITPTHCLFPYMVQGISAMQLFSIPAATDLLRSTSHLLFEPPCKI